MASSASAAECAPSQAQQTDSLRLEASPHKVAVLKRRVKAAGRTNWHSHRRSQLLYATSGLMIVSAEQTAWLVPTGHALLLAANVVHDAACIGPLDLCTAYIKSEGEDLATRGCRVVKVSALLDAALQALGEEQSGDYDPNGRGGALSTIVLSEIRRAPDAPLAVPMPTDARLRRMCDALVRDPAIELDLDAWASEVGLSRRTLTRRFREEVSLSFAEWRRRLRASSIAIRQAEGQSLREAAGAVGYRTAHGLRGMLARTSAERTTAQ